MPKGLFESYELLRGSGKKLGLWAHVLEGVSSLNFPATTSGNFLPQYTPAMTYGCHRPKATDVMSWLNLLQLPDGPFFLLAVSGNLSQQR